MRHMKLWIILIILFLVVSCLILFGRGWIGMGTGMDPSGETHWGPYWDSVKYKEDMGKLQRYLGLKKDLEEPPASH